MHAPRARTQAAELRAEWEGAEFRAAATAARSAFLECASIQPLDLEGVGVGGATRVLARKFGERVAPRSLVLEALLDSERVYVRDLVRAPAPRAARRGRLACAPGNACCPLTLSLSGRASS